MVTGAAGGIGAALCRAFADEGMRVIAGDIDGPGAEATAAACRSHVGVRVDVADADSMAAFADEAFATFGQVDVLSTTPACSRAA